MNKTKAKKSTRLVSLILAMTMLLAAVSTLLTSCEKKEADPIDDNYRTFYQIFVGSFSDSDGDGTGDIRGIINRMDYLNDGNVNSTKSLGVQGIWLSPIFQSSSYHKYDATDYYSIDKKFGTMDDLVELLELCHERNVKVILDLAINHTSKSNKWFTEFRKARSYGDMTNKYYDYYTCVTEDEKVGGRTYYSLGNGYYYEGNFDSGMPELNYDNPAVRNEMLELAKYYLDLGVDGFRFDAVKYIYYGDTDKTVEFWEWYMEELRAYKPDIYCVGECWSGDTEVQKYYTAMNCFDFTMSAGEGKVAEAAKGKNLYTYANYVASYQKTILSINPDSMMMSFLSNHDQDRIAGTFTNENMMRMAANLYLLAPGSPTIYYGEEIGMRGSRGSANTDANRRLAMLWGDGDTVKDPTGSTYDSKNQIQTTVKDQMKDKNSLYRYYCQLLTIRHSYPAIARGKYTALQCGSNKNLGGFIVEYNGELMLIIHNTSTEEITYDLSTCSALSGFTVDELCDYIGVSKANLKGTVLTIGAQTSVIIK